MNKNEFEDMKKMMMQDKEGGSSKFWKPGSKKEGKFPIRILPPMKQNDEKLFYFKHKVHFIDGRGYECLNQSLLDAEGNFHEAETCPACQLVSKLYNSSERDTEEWKLAGSLKARERFVSRIIVRGKQENKTKPEFYEYGPRIWEKLFNILTESDFGNILDPKNGRDFIINKNGTGRNSDYSSSIPAADKSPIFSTAEELTDALKKATDMKYNSLIEFTSAEAVKKALNSYLSGGVEETEPTPTTRKETTNNTKTNEDYYEEPDTDDSDDDDEDDEINSILNDFIDG